MTSWDDPLVIATLGLVATSVGLIVATSFYAFYTKKLSGHTARQVELLEKQEKVMKAQVLALRYQVKMWAVNYRGSGHTQASEQIVNELEKELEKMGGP